VRAVLVFALVLGALAPSGAVAVARPGQAQSPPPQAMILVNADTGQVLAADNEHEPVPPASTAKVMTALTAIERLASDTTITVSELAAAQPAMRIGMAAGGQWRFEDALASLMLVSANDAAYAIAETAGGSLDGFAAAMNETAARLGMEDSSFSDPAGFDDATAFGGGPRVSAYDLAIATRNALTVPDLARLASTQYLEFVDPTGATRALTNHNKMLPGGTRVYDGATGFKTGFTDLAGQTLVATAERDGCSLIAVVLNTYDIYGWAAQYLDQGFAMSCRAEPGAERLPEVAVWPYAQRVEDRQGFVALARGPDAASTTTTVAPTGADLAATTPLTEPAPGAALGAQAPAAAPVGVEAGPGSRGLVSVQNLAIVGVALSFTAFVLRRRAVKRRRARRIAAQRARAARMRSGGLTVVDGRFRTGTRAGPPLESHVRIRRLDE